MAGRGLRVGNVSLGKAEPRVIAPFTDRSSLALLRLAKKRGLSLLEARVDLFANVERESVVAHVGRARAIAPVLATVRSAEEGGKWKRGEPERLALYRALAPHADALDVELDAAIRPAVVRAARKARRPVVLSHHDFEKTPSAAALDDVVARSAKAGADVIKIATFVRKPADVLALARLFKRHRSRPLVVIGMGERGRVTRVLFPVLGSLFTFASLDEKSAPGQLGLGETLRGIERSRALLR
jgi:3-dehydroquinate dehydratase-1